MKKFKLLLFITLLISNLTSSQSITDYNPMHVGNYWVQQTDSINGGYQPTTFRMDIEGTDPINGVEYFRMKQEMKVNDGSEEPSNWYMWIGYDSLGISFGAFGNTSDLDSAEIFDPPIISFPSEANTVGAVWEFVLPGTGIGDQHFTYLLESFSETVEAPAGTYNNCMKMSVVITDTLGDTIQTGDYYYALGVGQVLNEGWSSWAENYKFELTDYYVDSTVSAEKIQNFPLRFKLEQNYPNPFNPSTEISYSIPRSNFATLKIFNMLGEEIKILVNEFQSADTYSVIFNGGELPSGVYFYRLQAGNNFTETKKMLLLR
jgi:hypothetical protein